VIFLEEGTGQTTSKTAERILAAAKPGKNAVHGFGKTSGYAAM
jgi:hypothetical protein